MPIYAKDIMTKKLVMIPVGCSLADAMNLMKEKRVRHLPVIDEMEKVVGILSMRDFSYLDDLETLNVETFMSVPVEWVVQDTLVRTAALRMIEKKIHALLIANENNEIVGIVTADDLLYLLAEMSEQSQSKHKISTLFDVQSLDEIANQISLTGI